MTLTVKHATLTGAAANPDVLVDGPAWDANHTVTGSVDATQLPALTGDVTSSAGSAVTTLAGGNAGNLNSGTLPAARMPALTGDVTTSTGAVATTLKTVNSNVGTFGSATQVAQVTLNAKGLATAASNVTVTPAIGSVTGLGTGVSTALGVNIGSAGAPVLFNGAGGTPSSIGLGNGTGLPVATGLSGLGSNVATFLQTASSANLRAALTDETGTGAAVFATSPTIATPVIQGITNGSPAIAGQVGEVKQNIVTAGSPVSISTGGVGAVWNSLSLTAGVWLVGGNAGVLSSNGALATHVHADTSTSTTVQTAPGNGSSSAFHVNSNSQNNWIMPIGIQPFVLSSTTTVNSCIICDFTGGTMGAYGVLWALRIV